MASCRAVVGRDYEPPALAPPEAYSPGLPTGDRAEIGAWWDSFDDPLLGELIDQAVGGNVDLRIALSRITESRARRGIIAADLVPTVDATGGYERRGQSREVVLGNFSPRAYDTWTLGLEAGWELDLWGRVRRAVEAAEAEIEASVEDSRAVLVSVLAETATAYVDLRLSQRQIEIATSNVELQSRTVQLTENQFDANLVSQLDVAQARSLLESTRASIPLLHAAARAARNRLAVLTGEFPGSLDTRLAPVAAIPEPKGELFVGIPADLIRRRPDLRARERELAAQTARVGVAEGALYPTLRLSGTLGLQAQDSSDLFTSDARAFSFGPSLRWNVFDRRRVRGAVAVEDARVEQALDAYELSVLGALEEVENSLASYAQSGERLGSLLLAVEEARRAVTISRDRYRQGLVTFQSVLDTQGRLFGIEADVANTRADIGRSLIGVYRALGGGWEVRDVYLAPKAESEANQTEQAL